MGGTVQRQRDGLKTPGGIWSRGTVSGSRRRRVNMGYTETGFV